MVAIATTNLRDHGWLSRVRGFAQAIADVTGTWDQPALPPVPVGHARVMVLTPGGPHFGQGPAAALLADPMAGRFLAAATSLLQLIVARAMP